MKILISSFLIFFTFVTFLNAQPQKVHRLVYDYQSKDWYSNQADLWEKELQLRPNNPDGWMSYYLAIDYSGKYAHDEEREKLQVVLNKMQQFVKDSYEYYYLLDRFEKKDEKSNSHWLDKAYKINPKRPDAIYSLVDYHLLLGNKDIAKKYLTDLDATKDISSGLMNYNYNVLQSVEDNAILFTNGDNDTYPVWVLQKVYGIKPNVTVLNLSMINHKDYFKQKLSEININLNISDLPAAKNENFSESFCITMTKKYPKIPVYFALTVYKKRLDDIETNLFISGLVSRYSSQRIDNIALLKKNMEKFRLDYLEFDWYDKRFLATKHIANLNTNYVASMVMLMEHYALSEDYKKADQLKRVALKLANKAGNNSLTDYINKVSDN